MTTESDEIRYYQRRVANLGRDLQSASQSAQRLQALQQAFFDLSQASEKDAIYETMARSVLRITGGTRAIITRADGVSTEYGGLGATRTKTYRSNSQVPRTIVSGSCSDLNAPMYTGEGRYFWVPISSIGGTHGHLYVDGVPNSEDDMSMEISALVRFGGGSLENLISAQAIAESNYFKDDLLFMFTHDFRSPLGAILLFADMLTAEIPASNTDARESVAKIIQSAVRLERMAEDALSLVKSQSAGFSLARESLELVEFVSASVQTHDPNGERIEFEALDPEVYVNADVNRMRQVVDNIISNSLKYSSGAVTIRVAKRDVVARITVQDSGIGIPEDEIPTLFSRMSRASNAKNIKGNGVGLYIANKIVTAHGGRITVSSRVGEGSLFDITLPI